MANKRHITIQIMKILHRLYENVGNSPYSTSEQNIEDSYILQLDNFGLIRRRTTLKKPQIIVLDKVQYDNFYESGLGEEKGLKDDYLRYEKFLKERGIWSDNTKFTENDVMTLMEIDTLMQYDPIGTKTQFEELSRRQISTWFQKVSRETSSKYLDNKEPLVDAFKKITGIENILGDDEKTQEFMFVVKCAFSQRKSIILFENLDRLKTPKLAQENLIESWYAGGGNTPKIFNWVNEVDVPIYYFCDWDRAGLVIYERIKGIFRSQGKDIILLTPFLSHKKSVFTPNHDDRWTILPDVQLSEAYYTPQQINIISDLKTKNEWIEEENHTKDDFKEILKKNSLIS